MKKDLNVIPNAADSFSNEEMLRIFRSMTKLRKFEERIVDVAHTGRIKVKVHMSSGQEAVAAAIAEAAKDYHIFTQHRSMDTYLALGGKPEGLRDELLCLDTGCCGGQIGGAFQIHERGINMYAHTGFIGENVSVGVGFALGSGKKTMCVCGDGGVEEDYALEAFGFAATHKLPVMFICTDNELSVLSPKWKRRTWELADVTNAFGIPSVDIADDPFTVIKYIRKFDKQLPALINVRVCRNYWHAGVGIDAPPEWDRYKIVGEQLKERCLNSDMEKIISEESKLMEELWKNYL